jgi:hypothetical protein
MQFKQAAVARAAIVFSLMGWAAPALECESRWWRVSVAVLSAAHVADAASSYGRQEANPALRGAGGAFTGRSVAVQAAVSAGVVAAQWMILRKQPPERRERLERVAAVVNFGAASLAGTTAVINWRKAR